MRPIDPRLLRHAAAARGYLIVTIALGLLTTGLVLAQAGLLAHALATAATRTGVAALALTLGLLLAVLAARAATAYGGELAALRAAASVKSQLRRRLTEHLTRLGPAWLGGQQAGEITTLCTKGLDALDPYFARFLPQFVLAFLIPVAVLARVAAADWISAVVIAVTLPLIPVFAVLIGLQTRAKTEHQWQLLARLGGHFLDVVEGLPTLKMFGRARAQEEVIRDVTGAHRSATMATLRVAFLSALVLELSAALATALVAVEVGLRLLAGHMSYQTALLVLLLTPEAYLPLRAVGTQFHASMEGVTAAGRACEILDVPAPATAVGPAPRGLGPAAPPPDLHRETITLNAVSLAYPAREVPALDGVTLDIQPGERIAVTGPSGAGKSSLLALLLRFTEPTSGRITAGAMDIAAADLAAWRRQIAWVPQQPYLFEGSVTSNIALGQPEAAPEAIEAAAAAAGAAEFIEALPHGYDTPLGERGARLSAGQRQRIAVARAFLRDAPLLLLDEPAAHLDPITARQLLDAIERLMAGRTVLLVTHGRGWTGGAARVISLDHGRLVTGADGLPARGLPADGLPVDGPPVAGRPVAGRPEPAAAIPPHGAGTS
jgi:ATP-binding cassette subfamily C protein CydD